MPRLRTAVLCGLVPATATAADPAPATLPGTVVPFPGSVPVAGAPPATAVRPFPVSTTPTAVTVSETPAKRPSALQAVKGWLVGERDVVVTSDQPQVPGYTGQTVTPTYQPAPAAPVAAPCPTPATSCATPTACATCTRGSGASWPRLKAWFCWKPSSEQALPIFVPTPYQAPLYTYFTGCREPHMTAAACGTAAAGHSSCGPAGCPAGVAEGPTTAAPAVAVKSADAKPRTKLIAAKASKPVSPPLGGTELVPGLRFASPVQSKQPAAMYQPVQPTAAAMTRPFTNP